MTRHREGENAFPGPLANARGPVRRPNQRGLTLVELIVTERLQPLLADLQTDSVTASSTWGLTATRNLCLADSRDTQRKSLLHTSCDQGYTDRIF